MAKRYSFEDVLTSYLDKELKSILSNYDYDVHCTQDINTYLEWQKQFEDRHVFAIVSSGGATQTSPIEKRFFTQALQVIITCSMNKKKEIYNMLDAYIKKQTQSVIKLDDNYSYYASFNWLTPISDSNIRLVNGARTMQITLNASITWCGSNFTTDSAPTITIDGVKLNGVYSCSYQKSATVQSYTTIGNAYQKKIEDFKTTTYTIDFIFDESAMQKSLLSSSNYYHRFKIVDGVESVEFDGFGSCSFVFTLGNFTSCQLVIVR